jgi:hypothetical protein
MVDFFIWLGLLTAGLTVAFSVLIIRFFMSLDAKKLPEPPAENLPQLIGLEKTIEEAVAESEARKLAERLEQTLFTDPTKAKVHVPAPGYYNFYRNNVLLGTYKAKTAPSVRKKRVTKVKKRRKVRK